MFRSPRQKFPTFHFTGEADPGFEKLIKQAVRELDLRDRRLFHPDETALYKEMNRNEKKVMGELWRLWDEGDPQACQILLKVGHAIFLTIPHEELLRWIPFNDVQFVMAGKQIFVHFRKLLRQSSPSGTIFFSRRRPTVEIDGEHKIIGFSRHAIEQICNRLNRRWFTYAALGDIFAFFDQCQFFELAELHTGQLAFSFFEECAKPFFSGRYVEEVLGEPATQRAYFRVGYCPASIEGEFLKAITFLFPGYRGTPEYGTIVNGGLFWNEQKQMTQQATTLTLDQIRTTGDFSLIKWFHDHGVPQVIETDEKFFAPAI